MLSVWLSVDIAKWRQRREDKGKCSEEHYRAA
jgi:hypothetical protein